MFLLYGLLMRNVQRSDTLDIQNKVRSRSRQKRHIYSPDSICEVGSSVS